MDSSSDDEPGLSAASYSSTGLAEALLRPLDYVRAVRELGTLCARAFQSSHRTLQKQLADDVAVAIQQCSWSVSNPSRLQQNHELDAVKDAWHAIVVLAVLNLGTTLLFIAIMPPHGQTLSSSHHAHSWTHIAPAYVRMEIPAGIIRHQQR